jgi:predicted methyltransferase
MSDPIGRALTDKGRPPRDHARDLRDHAAEVLAFADLRPGEVVADFLPFRGYFTRLFSALVGPSGRVFACVPEVLTKIERIAAGRAEIAAFAPGLGNVALLDGAPEDAGAPPEPLDLFWIAQNYHDLHDPFMGPVDIGRFNAAAFAALKPGGRLILTDHVAEPDAPGTVTDTLHRISSAQARLEFEAAGFVFDGQSSALANPDDTHRLSVFAQGRRYHTDRFIYRFRRPS